MRTERDASVPDVISPSDHHEANEDNAREEEKGEGAVEEVAKVIEEAVVEERQDEGVMELS